MDEAEQIARTDNNVRRVRADTCVLRGGVRITFDPGSPAEASFYLSSTLAHVLLEQLREAAHVKN